MKNKMPPARPLLRINASTASQVFGRQLFEDYYYRKDVILDQVQSMYIDRMEDKALHRENSGSISLGSAISLALFTELMQPEHIAEVGTYIGCSAAAMAIGGLQAGSLKSIDTCDINPAKSNPLDRLQGGDKVAVKVHTCNSAEMFASLVARKAKIDLLHIDGRITEKEIKLIEKLFVTTGCIILDDCESDEKGHVNLDFLRRSGLIDTHFFIQPFDQSIFELWGVRSRSTTGFIIPKDSVSLLRQ